MRIITGTAKGVRLETLEGENTRPTTEKIKEAVFSAIQFDIEGCRTLDLFAGSGQLGLEALSRGAQSCMFVDSEREAREIVKRNAQKTKLFDKVRLVCTDYKSALKSLSHKEKFGIIFLDPPYKSNYIEQSLRLIIDGDLLDESGYVVCETENPVPVEAEGLNVYKHSKYGRAYVTILTKKPKEEDEE
jgi:16S rRNA (guanine(966)-N(2))-methyltransferase RsmD